MKFAVAFSAAALAAVVSFSGAEAANRKVDIVNKTGQTLTHFYASTTNADSWEEDILGKDTLEDGDSQDIGFHRADKSCKWDLKVVYSDDDSSAVWSDVDLCSISKITIKYNRKSDTTSAVFD